MIFFIEATNAGDCRNWCVQHLKGYVWRMNLDDLQMATTSLSDGTTFSKNPDQKIAFEFVEDHAASAFQAWLDPVNPEEGAG